MGLGTLYPMLLIKMYNIYYFSMMYTLFRANLKVISFAVKKSPIFREFGGKVISEGGQTNRRN